MSDWATGYGRALADLRFLASGRKLMTPGLQALLDDMQRDADVIGHEEDNRMKKRRLTAAREALPIEPLLFREPRPPRLTRPTR